MMSDPIARYPFSGSASYSTTFPELAEYLVIYNDGDSDLAFSAGKFSSVIKAGDAFDERINPFDRLTVTATKSFHGYVHVLGGGQ